MRIQSVCAGGILTLAGLSLAPNSSGQVLFQDNFDTIPLEHYWQQNFSESDPLRRDAALDTFYDYSAMGIPSAPNSTGGSTIGMRFLVNQSVNIFQGISASPISTTEIPIGFNGDFTMTFDAWINFVGSFPAGGSGSTQSASFGWGTSGFSPQWAGEKNSVLFSATGDGGSSVDYRAYLTNLAPSAGAPILPSAGVYAAGTSDASPDSRNNSDPYYAGFGGVEAPAAQLALYPGQFGTTATGTLGMAWHEMRIEKIGNLVSWYVDDLRFATVPIDGASLGGRQHLPRDVRYQCHEFHGPERLPQRRDFRQCARGGGA